MVEKDYAIVFIFSTCYTMLYFNGIIYLIMSMFFPMLGIPLESVTAALMIKGFVIGFTGYLICELLRLRGFIPLGWIGSMVGLLIAEQIFIFTAAIFGFKYASLYGSYYLGISEFGMRLIFIKMLVVGSFIYLLAKFLIKYISPER